jgi:ribonuclease HI
MFFDGALNINGARAGMLFVTPSRDKLCYVLQIHFPTSNNATEYEVVLHSLRIAVELGVKCLMVYGDSTLVIN